MRKQEFMDRLWAGLYGLPKEDVEERLDFYSEMIDDRMEDGLTEEAAVEAVGPVDEIISQIIAETPLTKIVGERMKPTGKRKVWEIVLLVLGSPIWLTLLIAAFAVLLSVYISAWAVIISLWAVEASFIVTVLASVAAAVIMLFKGQLLTGLCLIAAALVLAGLSIFLFFGCLMASKGILLLTKKIVSGIKSLFLRKENAR